MKVSHTIDRFTYARCVGARASCALWWWCGTMDRWAQAYEFIIKNGIDTEASYKYTAGNGKASNCSRHWPPTSPVRIEDYKKISSNEPAMQAFATTNGPIAVGLDAAGPAWKHCECRSSLFACFSLPVGRGAAPAVKPARASLRHPRWFCHVCVTDH